MAMPTRNTRATTPAHADRLNRPIGMPPPLPSTCRLSGHPALALVFGEGLAQLLNCDLFLFGTENDLSRQHHAHRAGGVGEKLIERDAEAALHVFDGVRQIGPDLRRALHAEHRDRV